MIPLFLLSSFSFTAKRSELVGFVALRDSAAPLSFSFVLQPRCIHTERWQRKERRRGIIGRQLYSGGETTEPTEPLTPAWTTCADAERKHAIRLRACSGRRQAFAHACSSSPCHTARSVWQELSTNGSAGRLPSDECAPETSPRLPPPRSVLANPALSTCSCFLVLHHSKVTAGLLRFRMICVSYL